MVLIISDRQRSRLQWLRRASLQIPTALLTKTSTTQWIIIASAVLQKGSPGPVRALLPTATAGNAAGI